MSITHKLDKIGATASSICAVHCLLMPLVITFIPLIGISFFASEWFEWTLLASSAIIGISSLCMGYKIHGEKKALAFLATGLAILAISHITNHHEGHFAWWPFIGGMIVATSHFINHKLCTTCKSCQCGS